MTQHNLCLNQQKAGLPRMPGQDGYSVSRTGAVYYIPLHPHLTREAYSHPETGHMSYYKQTQGGGLKAQGIDKHSLGIDKHSLGIDKFSLGTDKLSLGTDLYSLGKDLFSLGKSKHSLGTDLYSLGTAKKVSAEVKQSRSEKGGGEWCWHTQYNSS